MRLSARVISTAVNTVFLMPVFLFHGGKAAAQVSAAAPYASGQDVGTPKVEVFLGYSYLQAVPKLADGNRLVWLNGGSANVAYNLNRHLGIVADIGDYTNSEVRFQGALGATVDVDNADGGALSYLFGPRYSFRQHDRFTPFAQVLFGGVHAGAVVLSNCNLNCTLLPDQNAFAMTAGGGLDINVRRHLAIRVIQAEYMMTGFQNYNTGESATQNDMRLSAGIVFRFGGNPAPTPVTLACSASPATIFPGDPVTVTAVSSNLDPKLNVIYSWTGVPGLKGNGTTASLDSAATGSLAAGSYTVKCGVTEGKPGKEGLQPWESASATASFTVKAFEPPTISCSASPSTINPGDKSAITAAGMSPQNRPLTYSYSAASGTINGTGASATFDSTGAPAGAVSITCNVTDDKSQTATAGTSVTVTAPYVPPVTTAAAEVQQLETRLALHSVFFQTDEPRIKKPNGGLLASQEGTLTTLATDFKRYLELKPDAYLTLTGRADVRGSVEYNQALSERRVTRTKLLLVEQGVPEASIKTLGLGKQDNLTTAQVEEAIKQNPELSAAEQEKLLNQLPVIVLAKNRRVDVTLSTTGQQSTQQYPFNAADALSLLDQRNLTHKKPAAPVKK
jgi:outer membrane protein OmpA-like peptidoglycan-associated protein/opacity protein-like surface antigen